MAINNPYQVGFNNYAPYQANNPIPVQQSFAPRQSAQGITWVNGEEAARSYPIPYNSTMLLMDQENPVLYVKNVDSMGRIVDFEIYDLINRSPKKEELASFNADDYVKKDDLDKMMSDLNKRFDEVLNRRVSQHRKEDR